MSFGALIEKFRAVALDRIERMNVLLVQLEHEPSDGEATEELLREIHTLKGEAKMMGFADVNLVAHQTEHLLTLITERRFDIPQNVVDVAFEGFDIVRQLLTKSAGAADAPVDLSGFVERVTQARNPADTDSTADSTPIADTSTPITREIDENPDPEPQHSSAFDDLAASLAPESWGSSAPSKTGEMNARGADKPADLSTAEDDGSDEELSDWRRPGSRRSTRTRIDGTQIHRASGELGDEPSFGASAAGSDRLLRLQVGGSLRVDLQKLERLGDVAGEVLLLSRRLNYGLGELNEIRDGFRHWLEHIDGQLPIKTISRLRNLVHRFDDFTSGARDETYLVSARTAQLDEEVRGLRHVPLAQVMSHYPRAVRDLAHEQGKRVRLVHAFGNVEVDRVLLSALSEPMLHLIRNAVDHGIESPEERDALGKEREAMIRLLAEYVGDSIRVVIEDDGRGIDPQLLREKAVARGLITAERAQTMRDQEALALIFEPGFSTRDSVSDVSGRGIGMDVVRRQITEMGGFIEVESEAGEGTAITMMLPVSSAVSQVLMVEIAGRTFALAAKQVLRVGAVSPFELMESHGGVFVEFDDEMVALHDWARVLGADGPRATPGSNDTMTVLLLRRGTRRVAVWVDQVLGEREAMSRPFGDFLRGIRLCRGVALTDSGEVVPLLNVSELLAHSENPSFKTTGKLAELATPFAPEAPRATSTAGLAEASAPLTTLIPDDIDEPVAPGELGLSSISSATLAPASKPADLTILVVEDSEITRDLVTGILKNHGYHFRVAEDGQIGWEMLQKHPVDLVLTDIQMPRMNGLELLSRIRESNTHADLPVVILTTLGDPKDKARALSLGADGYLVKLDFQESDLVEMVRRHLSVE